MKIYCDTNTLPRNIRDPAYKVQRERAALKELADKFELFSSKFVLKEVMKTPDETQRDYLIVDYRALEPVPKDERFYGSYTLSDPYGGRIENPLVSDVQDEALVRELREQGLKNGDPEHIVQAVCNECDVFLTRDIKTIIRPHREWLEKRFPGLKIRLPSELLDELTSQLSG